MDRNDFVEKTKLQAPAVKNWLKNQGVFLDAGETDADGEPILRLNAEKYKVLTQGNCCVNEVGCPEDSTCKYKLLPAKGWKWSNTTNSASVKVELIKAPAPAPAPAAAPPPAAAPSPPPAATATAAPPAVPPAATEEDPCEEDEVKAMINRVRQLDIQIQSKFNKYTQLHGALPFSIKKKFDLGKEDTTVPLRHRRQFRDVLAARRELAVLRQEQDGLTQNIPLGCHRAVRMAPASIVPGNYSKGHPIYGRRRDRRQQEGMKEKIQSLIKEEVRKLFDPT